jgi:NAD(P)H-dependent flavin oxidoreductase YrpB (nitropropane dioxygenase family)
VLRTRVCQLLGIEHPVVMGGMGTGTSPELVAAVSSAGVEPAADLVRQIASDAESILRDRLPRLLA